MKPVAISHEELSNLIGLVYETALEDPQWKRFLDRMVQLFPGTGALVLVHQGNKLLPAYTGIGNAFEQVKTTGIEVDFLADSRTNALEHLLIEENGFIARTKKLADADTYFASRFYRDAIQPNGFRHFMALKLDSHNNRGAMIVFNVSADPELEAATHDPLFELLKLLAPHAVRALQLARALTLARNALSVMGGFLDTIVLPLVVVTGKSEFVFANAAGRRLLAREGLMRVTGNSRVEFDAAHDGRAFSKMLRKMESTPLASGLRIDHPDGPLSLCLTPFRPALNDVNPIDRDLLQEERLFAIFIGQSGEDAVNLGLLQDTFDLTARESEVCADLLAGQSPAQIAERSGRALKTVRNQIQAVHDKIGVTTQAELAEALSVFRTVGALFDSADLSVSGAGRARVP